MAVTHAMNNLEKLTEENFDLWKLQMKSVLVYNELWAYVNAQSCREAKTIKNGRQKTKKHLH